jgi:hypothetical protein
VPPSTNDPEHPVSQSKIERLLRLVHRTADEELSCTECFDLLPHYVDLEIGGHAPATGLPLFAQHLVQCTVCREEYETLRELARLEAEGHPPSVDDLRRSL